MVLMIRIRTSIGWETVRDRLEPRISQLESVFILERDLPFLLFSLSLVFSNTSIAPTWCAYVTYHKTKLIFFLQSLLEDFKSLSTLTFDLVVDGTAHSSVERDL